MRLRFILTQLKILGFPAVAGYGTCISDRHGTAFFLPYTGRFQQVQGQRPRLSKLLTLILVLMLSACASYTEETREIRSLYTSQNFKEALTRLESSSLSQIERHRLLYLMEKASILDAFGEGKKSRKSLQEAADLVDKLYTVSISKTAATFLVNESMSDYEGEDFEKVAIHTLSALSYLQDGQLNSARVEAKKINARLEQITKKYDPRYRSYAKDAFALFLAGLIYEASGDIDDAIIDYRAALALFRSPAYRRFYQGEVPRSLVTSLYKLYLRRSRDQMSRALRKDFDYLDAFNRPGQDDGDLVVIHQAGRIAHKVAHEFVWPFGRQLVRFSFPIIPRHFVTPLWGYGVTYAGVRVDASNVSDMNAIAHYTLEERRGRLLAKGAARLLLKGQLTESAYENFGPLGGLAANLFSAVTETADTRGWTLLPRAFFVTRMRLPAGVHVVEILSAGRQSFREVKIEAGKLRLIRDIAF